jgi:hypothetical protein
MEPFSDLFAFVAGIPAVAGLVLTALIIFLTSDWRLSLTALLVQYLLAGLALTRFIQAEVAIVKILVGVLAVFILYITARRIQEAGPSIAPRPERPRFLGVHVSWGGGPLGLPLRLLVILVILVGLIHVFSSYDFVLVSADLTFVAFWLGTVGMAGLVLSSQPQRVAPAILTILTGFDLIYASMETSLAMVGFLGSLILLAALGFSYLFTVAELRKSPVEPGEEESPS